MSSFDNHEHVHNQVGHDQYVQSTVYHGPVTNTYIQSHPIDDNTLLIKSLLSSLAFPRMFQRQSDIEAAHMDTCQWILDTKEYRQWTVSGGLVWIKGIPGAGKSTLMSYLQRRLFSDLRVVSNTSETQVDLQFFFHRRGSKLQRSPTGMLRSLLNQLLRQCPESCRPLITVFEDRYSAFGFKADHVEWHQRELEFLLTKCVVEAMQLCPILILIDAIDEAGDESARHVAKYFHHLNAEIASITPSFRPRICMSSRHYPMLSVVRGSEIWVERHNRGDIALFVQDTLRLADWRDHGSSELEEWNDLQADIIRRSNGVFLWIRLVTPMLEQQLSDGLPIQYARQWVQQVPQELEKIYADIMRRLIKAGNQAQSLLLFQWVCLAERPLNVTELRYAMAANNISWGPPLVKCCETDSFVETDQRMELRIRALSGGLIEVAELHDSGDSIFERGQGHLVDLRIVQLIHQSVKDFLMTKGLRMLSPMQEHIAAEDNHSPSDAGSVDVISQGHAVIYRSCLEYIAVEGPEVGFEMPSMATASTGGSFANISCKGQMVPLTSYAAHYVFLHAEKASPQSDEELSHQVKVFGSACDSWLALRGDIDVRNEGMIKGAKPIHVFAFFGLNDLINQTLYTPSGVDKTILESKTTWECTPLHIAVYNGKTTTVKMLIDAGAEINLSRTNYIVLVQAVRRGNGKDVNLLLSHEAETRGKHPRKLDEALSYLDNVSEFKAENFHFCVEAVCDYHQEFEDIMLEAACFCGDELLVRLFIEAGGNPNSQKDSMSSLLYDAVVARHSEVVRSLIEGGANLEALGGKDGTALGAAICMGETSIADMLLNAGANKDIHVQGSTLLQAALRSGQLESAQILLTHGTDVNARGSHGTTWEILQGSQTALGKRFDDAVSMLMEHGLREESSE